MPVDISKDKLKRGDTVSYSRGKLTAIRWKDKKDVSLLSTIHNAEMVEVERRGVTTEKPKAVMDYNNTMGGVDSRPTPGCLSNSKEEGKKIL